MDVMGHLFQTERGNQYILVTVDLTRFAIVRAIANNVKTIAEAARYLQTSVFPGDGIDRPGTQI